MKVFWSRLGRRLCKILAPALYVLIIFVIIRWFGWKLLFDISTDETYKAPNYFHDYIQIVGDEDDSLPVNYERIDLLGEIENSTRNPVYKIIAVDTSEFSQSNLNGCPDWNCQIVYSTGEGSPNISAFVIKSGFPDDFKRRPDQYFVFFSQEAPTNWAIPSHAPSIFNLTMGYRRDADAPCPYGYFVKKPFITPFKREYIAQLEKVVEGKTKFAAWFVSNCYTASGRMELVDELRKYINVDIFGGCGPMVCPKGVNSNGENQCNMMLEREYKFYFAFENSICQDYTTEKFWEKMSLNVIVVVLSRRILDKYAPKKSFIAADDFESPIDLANYLLLLDQNPKLYMEYFKWREKYESIYLNGLQHDIRERPWGFCRLCKILWRQPPLKKIYSGLLTDGYWHEKQCHGNILALMKSSGKNNSHSTLKRTQNM